MPIIFISKSKTFIDYVIKKNYYGFTMNIEDFIPMRKTFYVSPANSLCYMDGGIDYPLSRIIMPGCEQKLGEELLKVKYIDKLNRHYLPIGSSIIVEHDSMKSLISAPTMLVPQDVSLTHNAYYAALSVLHNILINNEYNIDDVDIIFTSMCCGYGKMSYKESARQIIKAIRFYRLYNPTSFTENISLCQPNIDEQPRLYANLDFFD